MHGVSSVPTYHPRIFFIGDIKKKFIFNLRKMSGNSNIKTSNMPTQSSKRARAPATRPDPKLNKSRRVTELPDLLSGAPAVLLRVVGSFLDSNSFRNLRDTHSQFLYILFPRIERYLKLGPRSTSIIPKDARVGALVGLCHIAYTSHCGGMWPGQIGVRYLDYTDPIPAKYAQNWVVFTTRPNPEVKLLEFDPEQVQWTRRGVTPTVTGEVQDRKLSLLQIVKKVEDKYRQSVEDQSPGSFISGVRFAIAEHPEDDLARAKRKVLQEHDWKPDDFDE